MSPPIPLGEEKYQFVCLPFALTSAPWVFTKIMKPVVGALRQMGIHLIIYLDDILIMRQEKENLMQLTSLVCQMFEALGLIVNMANSQLNLTQKIELLGFLVNSVSLHPNQETEKNPAGCQLPPEKAGGIGHRSGKVCGKTMDGFSVSPMAVLQSSVEHNQFSCFTKSIHGEDGGKVTH